MINAWYVALMVIIVSLAEVKSEVLFDRTE